MADRRDETCIEGVGQGHGYESPLCSLYLSPPTWVFWSFVTMVLGDTCLNAVRDGSTTLPKRYSIERFG